MTPALERLANWIALRPKAVLAAVLSLGVLAGALGIPLVGELRFSSSDLETRGSESVRAADTIERLTGVAPAPTIFALLHSTGESLSPRNETHILAVAHTLEAQRGIAKAASYPQATPVEKLGLHRYFSSHSGHWAFIAAVARAGVQRTTRASALARRLLTRLPPGSGVLLGGSTIADEELGALAHRGLARTELWVLPLLALLLILIFRRPVAAALPLLIGVLTILETFALLRLFKAAGAQVSLFCLPTASGLSLGLGIDYSLLGVSRFREEARRHSSPARAASATLGSAGRTILFSAATIGCCMAVLMLIPIPLVFSVGLAVGLCACIAAANAILVLPAAGVLFPDRLHARVGRPGSGGSARKAWLNLASFVTRHPWPIAIAVSTVLLVLAIPAFGLRFHGIDVDALPKGAGARVAAEILEREFEPSVSDEILSLLIYAPRSRKAEISEFQELVAITPGVRDVNKAHPIGPGIWELSVLSRGARLSPASIALAKRLRTVRGPFRVEVSGPSPSYLDQQAALRGDLIAIVLVIALSTYALMFSMTKSIVLPLKTLLMNALTFAATFGLIVLLFQRDPLMSLFAGGSRGYLELTQPILMVSAVFGLSTDYNIFVISRIQEARRAGYGDRAAIAEGLSRSGPVVTAAALVFCLTIAAFATSSIMLIRETAAGMAIAVLIDATLVRALLLPSLMTLLGPYNWWLPKPLRWLFDEAGAFWDTLG
jgi:uncharacterized membrane protein YdfJ with MMPL/SSD domain